MGVFVNKNHCYNVILINKHLYRILTLVSIYELFNANAGMLKQLHMTLYHSFLASKLQYTSFHLLSCT